jgi:hypothetical protein
MDEFNPLIYIVTFYNLQCFPVFDSGDGAFRILTTCGSKVGSGAPIWIKDVEHESFLTLNFASS